MAKSLPDSAEKMKVPSPKKSSPSIKAGYDVHPHYLFHQSSDIPKLPWHHFSVKDEACHTYFMENLSFHLEKSNRNDLLEESILNVKLLAKKLVVAPDTLLNDFSFVNEFYTHCHPMFKWIYGALQMSMPVLQVRPDELGSQFLGRMAIEDRDHPQQEQFIADILDIQENKPWLFPFNRLTGLDLPRHCCPEIENTMNVAPKDLFLEDLGGCCQVLVAYSDHHVVLLDRFLGTMVLSLSIETIRDDLNQACKLKFMTRSSTLPLHQLNPKHPTSYKGLSDALIVNVLVFNHFLLVFLSNGCLHISKLYIIKNNLKFQLYPIVEDRLNDLQAGSTIDMKSKHVNTLFLMQQLNMLFPNLIHVYKLYDNILFITQKKSYYLESMLNLYSLLRNRTMMKIEILLQTNSWKQESLDPSEFIPYFNLPAMEQPKGLNRPPRQITHITHFENTLAFATDDKFIITYAFQSENQQEFVDTIRTSYDYDISMLCLNKDYLFSVELNRYYVDMWCRKQSIHLEYLMDRHSIEAIEASDDYLYTMVAEKIWVWSLVRRQKVFRLNLTNCQVHRFVVDSENSIITGSKHHFKLHDLQPCDVSVDELPKDSIATLSCYNNFIFAISSTHLKSIYCWTLDEGTFLKKVELPYLLINNQLQDGGPPSSIHLYDNYCIVGYYNQKVHCMVVYEIAKSEHNDEILLNLIGTTDIEGTQLSCIHFNEAYSELVYLAGQNVHLWNLKTNKNITGFISEKHESITSILWDKENDQLITGDQAGKLRVWSTTSQQCVSEMGVSQYRLKPMRCMYIHEGSFILAGNPKHALHFLSHTHVHFPTPLPYLDYSCIAVDPSESLIAFGFSSGKIELYSITHERSLCSYTADSGIQCMTFTIVDDIYLLVAGCSEGRIVCLQAQF